ncbi:PIN domain-containing protein [Streptomyces sp. NPDC056503]|uniref:PIN domain-containing protein n=1 Tax=Streptomyces sp. NPDC056503 TaxID=3345842 RepID=UPI0036C24714
MADTSGLLAAFDQTDPLYEKAAWALNRAGLVVMSPLVLAELDHLSRSKHPRILHHDAVRMMLDLQKRLVDERLVIPAIEAVTLERAQLLRQANAGLDLDLADATTVVLAWEWSTYDVLTLDQNDFRALRLPNAGYFRVLPADL